MSLESRLLLRAHSCTARVNGFSMVSKGQHNPLLFQPSSPQRFSSLSPSTGKAASVVKLEKGRNGKWLIEKKKSNAKPVDSALIRQAVQFPDKKETRRSFRKHVRSAATQAFYEAAYDIDPFTGLKTESTVQSTFDFMMRHTPQIGEALYFRVILGKGVAAEARELLLQPDMRLSQISQRNESVIRIEETSPESGELVLALSGYENSVLKSLLEIVGVVGKITAIRVSDPAWESVLRDLWRTIEADRPGFQLLGNKEVAVDDRTATVLLAFPQSMKYKNYTLTKRADEIARPTEWTKVTFEEYVAALVHGQVPTHLARSLYPGNSPDHQSTVISILTELFTSEHTKEAASVSALKMAIRYIESRGFGFHQKSRDIFIQAESMGLPMDAEIFDIFLVTASKAKALINFNSILRMMVRKGYPPQSRAWAAFMEMVQDPKVKRSMIQKLIQAGYNRNPAIRRTIVRQIAMNNLEKLFTDPLPPALEAEKLVDGPLDSLQKTARDRQELSTQDKELVIQDYIEDQNKHGSGWLDTMTLNRIVDVLGAHKRVDLCFGFLEVVSASRVVSADVVTLNTILTHVSTPELLAEVLQSVLRFWPKLTPDNVTYEILFRTAWKRRCPNMLRVIWRYAAFAKKTTSKLRYRMERLFDERFQLRSKRRGFYKGWEDMIAGLSDFAEIRALDPDEHNSQQVIIECASHAGRMKPIVPFATKLKEAQLMDKKIHKLVYDQVDMSPSMIESLSVDIPCVRLVPRDREDGGKGEEAIEPQFEGAVETLDEDIKNTIEDTIEDTIKDAASSLNKEDTAELLKEHS
ncbi:hypothetical protein GGR54DRAFT_594438 [Hypoxylon sp. NC1633]|nr:hypothetical protein GGR54DRAFT_594438 [Hypoxylon sp. NC1633]